MDSMFLAVAWYVPLLVRFLFGSILTPVLTQKLRSGSIFAAKTRCAIFTLFCFCGRGGAVFRAFYV